MLTRRQMLAAPFAAPLVSRAQTRRLNVLLIAVDDLNNRIACYGDPVVKTPNIDRLAGRGVRFDRAYCNYPLCNPSRTSLLSGLRPDTTRILDNRTSPRTHLKDHVFLPEYFKQHGYFTARRGKIAHGAFEDAIAWDISEQSRGAGGAAREGSRRASGKKGKDSANEGGAKLAWRKTQNEDSAEPDGQTALRVAEWMEQNRDRPFFLGAGFHKPHLPWVAPRKYFDMYPPELIRLPDTPANDRDDIPPAALTHTAGDQEMSDADRKQAIAAYHACTSFTDAQIGVLLDAMDRLKLWESTIVLLFGDHGWHLYDHLGLWRKMTVFEQAARAPLIVAAPGGKRGVSSGRLVEFVDIYPSLLELAGLPARLEMEGASFAPLLKDPQRPWKKAAFTVVKHKELGRSIRTDRYRYTEWGGPGIAELYDHEKDPFEFTNLARDPQSAKPLAEMRGLLTAGWKAALPASR